MIQVQGLTKIYRGRPVVDEVSFEVGSGEIVGFLGPNGAGKSTTLRMLAGYVLPTSGVARVAGHDVVRDSLAARSRLGYMPEDVPLYADMRVEEYLGYRARLKGVSPGRVAERLAAVMERCGVADVRRHMIGGLSKGYRQRIGLADALVHEPDILILDEPTNGLDPNQIRSVREIIRSFADRHTVLLSTHILAEVEAVCHRVIILDRGQVRATGHPARIARRLERAARILAEVHAPEESVRRVLGGVPGVNRVEVSADADGWLRLRLEVDGGDAGNGTDPREAVHRLVCREGWRLRHLSLEPASLEEVFAGLTMGPEPEAEPREG
jgi:ABC-2 type transport system ATP-binding protein